MWASKAFLTFFSDGLFDLSFVIWLALFSDEVDSEDVEEAGGDERGVDDDDEEVVEGLSSSISPCCILGAFVDGIDEEVDTNFLSSTSSSCFLGTFVGGELWSLKPLCDFLTTLFGFVRFVEPAFWQRKFFIVLKRYTFGIGRIRSGTLQLIIAFLIISSVVRHSVL